MTNDWILTPSSVRLKEEWQEGKKCNDVFANTEIQLLERKSDQRRVKVFVRNETGGR